MKVANFPLITNRGWGLVYRATQCIFAILTMSLAAYSFSRFPSWFSGRIVIGFVYHLPERPPLTVVCRSGRFLYASHDTTMEYRSFGIAPVGISRWMDALGIGPRRLRTPRFRSIQEEWMPYSKREAQFHGAVQYDIRWYHFWRNPNPFEHHRSYGYQSCITSGDWDKMVEAILFT